MIDLLPKMPGQSRRFRKRLFKDATRQVPGAQSVGMLDGFLGGQRQRAGRLPAADAVDRLFQTRALQRKLDASDPLFATQILLCVRARERARAKVLTHALLSCFDVFAGENHLCAAGLRFGGLGFLGVDAPWRRGGFDRRLRTGRFAPMRESVLGASEIAGLLKPPTARCYVENVARSGGAIPPPPPGLPTFTGQEGLIPLGKISERRGERIVGVPVAGTFFAYMAGRSRYGKTETAIGQFIALARSGQGGLFLDPHADAIKEISHISPIREYGSVSLRSTSPTPSKTHGRRRGTCLRWSVARRRRPPGRSRRSWTRSPPRSAGMSATPAR